MKPISELGLELIELEDQVLLVENGEIPNNWYLDDANQIRQSVIDNPDWWCARKGYHSIIASTKSLEGLPLLVIEDEVHELSKEYLEDTTYEKESDDQFIGRYSGFMSGYNKAKETYKFTEEDLRNAFKAGVDWQEGGTILYPDEEGFIQSLAKKELWIETTISLYKGNGTYGMEIPKITNNQIKAIWK